MTRDGIGCVVVADDPSLSWTWDVMKQVQGFFVSSGFVITEVIPRFHHYHLVDNPELTSCSLIAVRNGDKGVKSTSTALLEEDLNNFYGEYAPLEVRYILDLRKGGLLPSFDHH